MSEADDVTLLERLRDDEQAEEAFGELVRRYQQELVAYFYHHCWRQDVAEDLAQTVFIKVFRFRARYQPTAKVRTFLYRIAHNAWVDHVRRRRRQEVSLDAERGGGLRLGDTLAAEPERGLGREEREQIRVRVQEAVEALPEGQRDVFVLANHHHMKYQEIGEILDIPEGTVKSRMYAAVRQLRERLQDLVAV